MDKHPSLNLLCLLTTQPFLSAQPCPSQEGLSPASSPGQVFMWAFLPLLGANLPLSVAFAKSWKAESHPVPIRVTSVSFYRLPAWLFVRYASTGQLHSSLTLSVLFFFLFRIQRGLATLKSVCFCVSYFSKLCFQLLRASSSSHKEKKYKVNSIRGASLETSGISFFWCYRLVPHNLGFVYLFFLHQGCRLTTVSSGRTSALLGRERERKIFVLK